MDKKSAGNEMELNDEALLPDFVIMQASLKDGFCNYAFEIKKEGTGFGVGDLVNVKGTGIFNDDLREAFNKMNVHLAFIDDIFKHKGIDIENIEDHHAGEEALDYLVSGFKILGEMDNEAIILIGSKHISTGGRLEMSTPKIYLDDHSSYKWFRELRDAVNLVREEVVLYKDGKCTHPDPDVIDKKEKKKQTKIKFSAGEENPDNDIIPGVSSEDVDKMNQDFAEAAR